MDADTKAVWTSALRSGEYVQGSGELCRESPIDDAAQDQLIQLNDIIKAGFPAIADWIDKNL